MLSLRLPAEAEARLTAMAKANGCTKTHFAREAILTYLSQHEDDAHVPSKLTAETLAKSERGEDVLHAKDAENLFKRLDLDSRKARLQALLDMEPCPDFEPCKEPMANPQKFIDAMRYGSGGRK